MDVIIIGAGNIGYTIARTLSKKHSVIIVEDDEERYNYVVENLDVGAMNANGASPKVLQSIMNEKTKLVIAVTAKDEVNIFACMVAKQIKGDVVTAARVRDPDYINGDLRNIRLNVDHIISPEMLVAKKLMYISRLGNMIDHEHITSFGIELAKFAIKERNRKVTLQPLRTLIIPDECKVIAIHRKHETIMPKGGEEFLVGDQVTVLGTEKGITDFNEMLGRSDRPKDFVIIGGGMVGQNLASMFESEKVNVRLIEHDECRCRRLSKSYNRVVVINENGSDPSVLRSENVHMAHVLMAVTESEETNLLACLIGKHMGVSKVMALYSRMDYEDVFSMEEIDVSIGYYHVVANEIVNLTSPEFKVLLSLEGFSEEFFDLEVKKQKSILGKRIDEIELPDRSIIALVVRDGHVLFPRPDLIISEKDMILIYASIQDIGRLERMFQARIPIGL